MRTQITTVCSVEACRRKLYARGWCEMHYARWRTHGDPLKTLMLTRINGTPEERFWAKVDPCRTDGCAVWVGPTYRGYGRFILNGTRIYAHHFLVGKPPKGMEWDHVKERGCVNKNCVWPDHLEAVTHHENVLRGDLSKVAGANNRAKTHCPQGHEYTPENTRNYKGQRHCRKCGAVSAMRRYYARRKHLSPAPVVCAQ